MSKQEKVTTQINRELNNLAEAGYKTEEYNCIIMDTDTYNQLTQELVEQFGLSLPISLTTYCNREICVSDSTKNFVFGKKAKGGGIEKESQDTLFTMLA